MRPIIVDTNIIFSALLHEKSRFLQVLLESRHELFICELILMELFKHKEKIIRLSQLPEHELIKLYYVLLKRLHIYKEELIGVENWQQAYGLCKSVDENDTPHVALTLELAGLLWTGDNKLKTCLQRQGFTDFFEY
ncbi:PIN domain-containing protein [Methylovulum psychrotolerans]|uniref:DNA-binding protein n=1 Tax=Methylovulum psychrotolerans TaxID=1704499 RepID=A0A1Z4BTJ1_9GAMM|nr:PIN domain-containing protein [Methylovulum psychrotolerans]ASF44634.1 DNA-binding protein [Methylovulum psychrotolerans]